MSKNKHKHKHKHKPFTGGKPWTHKDYNMAVSLRNQGWSYQRIASALGRGVSAIDHALRPSSTVPRGLGIGDGDGMSHGIPTQQHNTVMPPRTIGTDDTIEAEARTEGIRTLDDLIKACKIDLSKWQVERWIANTWPVGAKDENGNLTSKNLYQVKANLKRIPLTKGAVLALFQECLKGCTKPSSFKKHSTKGSKVLEISIPDLHLGKLAWDEETGHDNYDSHIAEKRFQDALEDLLSRGDKSEIGSIILPIGNDYFNVNSKDNVTAHGTPQNEDGRWQKSFRRGCKLAVWAANKCHEIAPVKIVIVAGNHDLERVFYLGEFLEAFFRNEKTIEVDNGPTPRKYHQAGQTLLCFTHGDRMKLNDLTHIAQVERRDLWGKTKFCEWHLGHLHRESAIESGGVVARVIPSLSPPDSWHSNSGYVTSKPSAQAFLYDLDTGLECIYYHRVR